MLLSWSAAYAATGITITSYGPDIIFTATVPGTGFTAPTITNATADLAGTVSHDVANVTAATSGAIRGRMEVGDREGTFTFTARFVHGSTELAKLLAQTEGTIVMSLSYDANNSLQLTYQRIVFSVAQIGDTDGIVTVQVTVQPLWHTTNGLLTAVAKCNTDWHLGLGIIISPFPNIARPGILRVFSSKRI